MAVIRRLFSSIWHSDLKPHAVAERMLLLSLISVVSSAVTAAPTNQTLRVCYEDQDYLPYTKGSGNGADVALGKRGVLPDLVLLATEEVGLKAEFVSLPWKRCIQQLEYGQVDAIFAAIWLPERDKWGVFPKTDGQVNNHYRLWRVSYKIHLGRDSILSWDGNAFSHVQHGIGAPLGYVAYKKLEAMGVLPPQNHLPDEGFRLLGLGRLDGYVIEQSIGEQLIRKQKLMDAVQVLEKDFLQADWYLPLSHQWYGQNTALARQLWQALSQMRELQGEALYQHYAN